MGLPKGSGAAGDGETRMRKRRRIWKRRHGERPSALLARRYEKSRCGGRDSRSCCLLGREGEGAGAGAKGEDVPATRLTFKRQEIESVACL